MKEELEICVKCFDSYEKLMKKLEKKNFVIKEDFQLNDIYMISKDIDINNTDVYEILNDYVLLRETVGKNKWLVHKYKEFNDKKEIIKQGKSQCKIIDINKAKEFMESLGYKDLFSIEDHVVLVSNGKNELYIQHLSNGDIYIEMEQENIYSDNLNGNDIDEMIKNLNKYKFKIGDFYFENKSINCLKEIKGE